MPLRSPPPSTVAVVPIILPIANRTISFAPIFAGERGRVVGPNKTTKAAHETHGPSRCCQKDSIGAA
jgi:hypothetical protein